MRKISIITTVLLTTFFLGLCMQSAYSQLPRVEFAVTYEVDTPPQDSEVDTEIWVSIHHSDGSVTHVEITDTPSGGGDPWLTDVEDPAIAMAPNGNIIVAWEQPTDWVPDAIDKVYYAVLDIDGTIIKTPTQLGTEEGYDPCVAVTPNNVVFIVWEYGPETDVVGYVMMDANGDNVSPIREITGFDDIDDPTVAASIQNGVDNRVVVAWEDPDEVVVCILDDNGITLVPKKMLTSGSPESNSEINAAILPTGNTVIVWERSSGDPEFEDDLYYTVIDKKGMTVIPVTVIDRPNDVGSPGVAATPEGNIVIMWHEEPVGAANYDVWYLILDINGNVVKEAVRLTTSDADEDDPDVAADVFGNVIIIYEQSVNHDKVDFGILSSVGQIFGLDQLTDGTDDIELDGEEGRRQVAVKPAKPAPVGGITIPTNKLEILTPYLALAGLIIAVSTVYVMKKRKD